MSRTRARFFASNYQPRPVVERLLTHAVVRDVLRRLSVRAHTLAELGLDGEGRALLRLCVKVDLVRAYTLGDTPRYRARRFPPLVHRALAADQAAAAA